MFQYYGLSGPKPSLFLDGNLSQFYKDKPMFEVEMDYSKIYGPTWVEHHGDLPVISSVDPEFIRHVFLEDTDIFCEKSKLYVDLKIGHGILFARYNKRGKFFRKILSGPLNRFTSRYDSSSQFVEESTRLMIDYIEQKIDIAKLDGKSDVDVDLYDLMKCIALYMISEIAIKLPVEIRENEPNVKGLDGFLAETSDGIFFRLSMIFPFLFNITSWLLRTVHINTYMEVIYQAVDKRFRRIAEKFEQESSRKKKLMILDKLENNDTIIDTLIGLVCSKRLTELEFLGNIEGLLIAGYDTTSTTLTYILWCLAKYTDVQTRLRNDLMVHGSNSKYLDQVINEVLRLYPVIISFINRLATKTTEFKGIVIPEETLIIYHIYVMHRDPTYWPDPEKFDPQRFAEGRVIDKVYFAPFGFGERRCLGAKLAMLEMKVVVSELLLRYKLILKSPQELKLKSCILYLSKPAEPIKIELEKI